MSTLAVGVAQAARTAGRAEARAPGARRSSPGAACPRRRQHAVAHHALERPSASSRACRTAWHRCWASAARMRSTCVAMRVVPFGLRDRRGRRRAATSLPLVAEAAVALDAEEARTTGRSAEQARTAGRRVVLADEIKHGSDTRCDRIERTQQSKEANRVFAFASAWWWVLRGSNPRPTPCKGAALPAELSTPPGTGRHQFSASFSALPGRNFGTLAALILIAAPVRGLRPRARSAFADRESAETDERDRAALLQRGLTRADHRLPGRAWPRPWRCRRVWRCARSVRSCSQGPLVRKNVDQVSSDAMPAPCRCQAVG